MGVPYILKYRHSNKHIIPLSSYRNQSIAVDISVQLHKLIKSSSFPFSSYVCQTTAPHNLQIETRYSYVISRVVKYLMVFVDAGVLPVVCFDNRTNSNVLKSSELQSRRQHLNDGITVYHDRANSEGDDDDEQQFYHMTHDSTELIPFELQATQQQEQQEQHGIIPFYPTYQLNQMRYSPQQHRAYDQNLRPNKELQNLLLTTLNILGLPVLNAPLEADAQCVHLCTNRLCSAVATTDSDLLLHGVTTLQLLNEKDCEPISVEPMIAVYCGVNVVENFVSQQLYHYAINEGRRARMKSTIPLATCSNRSSFRSSALKFTRPVVNTLAKDSLTSSRDSTYGLDDDDYNYDDNDDNDDNDDDDNDDGDHDHHDRRDQIGPKHHKTTHNGDDDEDNYYYYDSGGDNNYRSEINSKLTTTRLSGTGLLPHKMSSSSTSPQFRLSTVPVVVASSPSSVPSSSVSISAIETSAQETKTDTSPFMTTLLLISSRVKILDVMKLKHVAELQREMNRVCTENYRLQMHFLNLAVKMLGRFFYTPWKKKSIPRVLLPYTPNPLFKSVPELITGKVDKKSSLHYGHHLDHTNKTLINKEYKSDSPHGLHARGPIPLHSVSIPPSSLPFAQRRSLIPLHPQNTLTTPYTTSSSAIFCQLVATLHGCDYTSGQGLDMNTIIRIITNSAGLPESNEAERVIDVINGLFEVRVFERFFLENLHSIVLLKDLIEKVFIANCQSRNHTTRDILVNCGDIAPQNDGPGRVGYDTPVKEPNIYRLKKELLMIGQHGMVSASVPNTHFPLPCSREKDLKIGDDLPPHPGVSLQLPPLFILPTLTQLPTLESPSAISHQSSVPTDSTQINDQPHSASILSQKHQHTPSLSQSQRSSTLDQSQLHHHHRDLRASNPASTASTVGSTPDPTGDGLPRFSLHDLDSSLSPLELTLNESIHSTIPRNGKESPPNDPFTPHRQPSFYPDPLVLLQLAYSSSILAYHERHVNETKDVLSVQRSTGSGLSMQSPAQLLQPKQSTNPLNHPPDLFPQQPRSFTTQHVNRATLPQQHVSLTNRHESVGTTAQTTETRYIPSKYKNIPATPLGQASQCRYGCPFPESSTFQEIYRAMLMFNHHPIFTASPSAQNHSLELTRTEMIANDDPSLESSWSEFPALSNLIPILEPFPPVFSSLNYNLHHTHTQNVSNPHTPDYPRHSSSKPPNECYPRGSRIKIQKCENGSPCNYFLQHFATNIQFQHFNDNYSYKRSQVRFMNDLISRHPVHDDPHRLPDSYGNDMVTGASQKKNKKSSSEVTPKSPPPLPQPDDPAFQHKIFNIVLIEASNEINTRVKIEQGSCDHHLDLTPSASSGLASNNQNMAQSEHTSPIAHVNISQSSNNPSHATSVIDRTNINLTISPSCDIQPSGRSTSIDVMQPMYDYQSKNSQTYGLLQTRTDFLVRNALMNFTPYENHRVLAIRCNNDTYIPTQPIPITENDRTASHPPMIPLSEFQGLSFSPCEIAFCLGGEIFLSSSPFYLHPQTHCIWQLTFYIDIHIEILYFIFPPLLDSSKQSGNESNCNGMLYPDKIRLYTNDPVTLSMLLTALLTLCHIQQCQNREQGRVTKGIVTSQNNYAFPIRISHYTFDVCPLPHSTRDSSSFSTHLGVTHPSGDSKQPPLRSLLPSQSLVTSFDSSHLTSHLISLTSLTKSTLLHESPRFLSPITSRKRSGGLLSNGTNFDGRSTGPRQRSITNAPSFDLNPYHTGFFNQIYHQSNSNVTRTNPFSVTQPLPNFLYPLFSPWGRTPNNRNFFGHFTPPPQPEDLITQLNHDIYLAAISTLYQTNSEYTIHVSPSLPQAMRDATIQPRKKAFSLFTEHPSADLSPFLSAGLARILPYHQHGYNTSMSPDCYHRQLASGFVGAFEPFLNRSVNLHRVEFRDQFEQEIAERCNEINLTLEQSVITQYSRGIDIYDIIHLNQTSSNLEAHTDNINLPSSEPTTPKPLDSFSISLCKHLLEGPRCSFNWDSLSSVDGSSISHSCMESVVGESLVKFRQNLLSQLQQSTNPTVTIPVQSVPSSDAASSPVEHNQVIHPERRSYDQINLEDKVITANKSSSRKSSLYTRKPKNGLGTSCTPNKVNQSGISTLSSPPPQEQLQDARIHSNALSTNAGDQVLHPTKRHRSTLIDRHFSTTMSLGNTTSSIGPQLPMPTLARPTFNASLRVSRPVIQPPHRPCPNNSDTEDELIPFHTMGGG